jgi:hypothetical protein
MRIARRNRQRGDTFAVVVSDAMFDALPWESPSEESSRAAA